MGIYDRDYYRRETSYIGAWGGESRVTTALIVINVVVFVFQLADRYGNPVWQKGWLTETFLLDPHKVFDGQVWRLVTYAFLHDTSTWLHVFFNMLFLGMFGPTLERQIGSKEFLTFYLVSAVLASVGYILAIVLGVTSDGRALGASGAVTAVLVVYAVHYPNQPVYLFFVLAVPVWLLVVFQVAQDVFGIFGGGVQRVAFAAHLSGAAFGFAYARYRWKITAMFPSGERGERSRVRRSPPLRVFRDEDHSGEPTPEIAPPPAIVRAEADEHLEAKLDQVLEKVARHGQESLSESEREILFRASEVYKRRRK
jgi:membrane associated rhomboid family serine protease